jgi:putative ABC transport system permease protein
MPGGGLRRRASNLKEGSGLFYLGYALAELRRRKARTLFTALGLAVGVGLVVTVSALSKGLDGAQHKVLEPLTGVGTDMSVTRPLKVSGSNFTPGSGPPRLSSKEQDELRQENGGGRFGLVQAAKPGKSFSTDRFVTATQLSFPASEAARIATLRGASDAAPALTLNAIHLSGRVPKKPPAGGPRFFSAGPGGGGAAGTPAPRALNFNSRTITGIDESKPSLGLVTPGQVSSGSYLSSSGSAYQALMNVAYARRNGYRVGSTFKLANHTFTVVGLATPPLGGSASDIYVKLATLQKLSGRKGRANAIQVRARDSGAVDSLAREIKSSFAGAQVTTAKDLADRVGGSLVDAKNLSGKLGTALEIVGLVAAFLIASLLTLSSVAKRTRELGTLKALGWRQRLVVRQVTAESLAQGLLGGVLGVALGVAGAAVIAAIGPTLHATVAAAKSAPGPFAVFGQGQVTSGSTTIKLGAPVDAALVGLALALAVAGGLLAGALGGLRAARLRPADALRSVE